MPDKKQGLFHSSLCALYKLLWISPEVQTPAPEAPGATWVDSEKQRQTFAATDQSLQYLSPNPGRPFQMSYPPGDKSPRAGPTMIDVFLLYQAGLFCRKHFILMDCFANPPLKIIPKA
jgi:hypothetical protein